MKQSHIFRFPNGEIYAVMTEPDAVRHLENLRAANFSVSSSINGVATFYTVNFTPDDSAEVKD